MSDNINTDLHKVIQRIIGDIRVELLEEYDRNFERQGFFSEKWQRRRSPIRQGRAVLIDSGALRRSIHSRTSASSVTFVSDLPYAAVHNEGGEIKVTRRMKAFFWHKYYEATGSFSRGKDGSPRRDKRNLRLSTEAEFWKAMALMRVGAVIRIPRRRFLGTSPEVEQAVKTIIEDNLTQYFNQLDLSKQ